MRLEDFALERFFARWEFSAEMLLCASDVEGWPMARPARAGRRGRPAPLDATCGSATPNRPAIPPCAPRSRGCTSGLTADDVLVFSGAEEAIFALHNVLLGPGDHAIVVRPAYQSLAEVARAAGAEVTRVELREADGWRLDVDRGPGRPSTEHPADPGQRAAQPHRLACSDRATFDRLVALAAESGARLIVDEVYRFLEFDRADRLPAGADALRDGRQHRRHVQVVRPGRAAHRLGRDARPRPAGAAGRVQGLHHDLQLGPERGPGADRAAGARPRPGPQPRPSSRPTCRCSTRSSRAGPASSSGSGRGAAASASRASLADVPIDRFAEDLVRETGVLILPGTLFGDPGNHFRIGFGRTNLPEALARLEAYAARTFG